MRAGRCHAGAVRTIRHAQAFDCEAVEGARLDGEKPGVLSPVSYFAEEMFCNEAIVAHEALLHGQWFILTQIYTYRDSTVSLPVNAPVLMILPASIVLEQCCVSHKIGQCPDKIAPQFTFSIRKATAAACPLGADKLVTVRPSNTPGSHASSWTVFWIYLDDANCVGHQHEIDKKGMQRP